MIEYQLIQQRQRELEEAARIDRLVREAAAAGHARVGGREHGALRRFARSLHRPAHAVRIG